MRLLPDTHARLWWLSGDAALSSTARNAIADEGNGIFVSAASLWETSAKHRIGKLPGLGRCCRRSRPRRDPIDRMLIAQAMLEKLVLVSNEQAFDASGIARLW